jgi:hypothetical protein
MVMPDSLKASSVLVSCCTTTGGQSKRQFVDDEEFRIGHDAARDREHLLLTAGKSREEDRDHRSLKSERRERPEWPEWGSCLTDATREDGSRRTVRDVPLH